MFDMYVYELCVLDLHVVTPRPCQQDSMWSLRAHAAQSLLYLSK